jgi:hypothetical protein
MRPSVLAVTASWKCTQSDMFFTMLVYSAGTQQPTRCSRCATAVLPLSGSLVDLFQFLHYMCCPHYDSSAAAAAAATAAAATAAATAAAAAVHKCIGEHHASHTVCMAAAACSTATAVLTCNQLSHAQSLQAFHRRHRQHMPEQPQDVVNWCCGVAVGMSGSCSCAAVAAPV